MTSPALRFATVSNQGINWLLRRNCSLSPGQLLAVYASLCLVSLVIGASFWMYGATLVIPFAGLEMAAFGLALWFYARHAADSERISLHGSSLVVELESGGRVSRTEFNREWVRVEPGADERSLIELSGQGRSISIGRFIRPELRAALAREIRLALRGASAKPAQ